MRKIIIKTEVITWFCDVCNDERAEDRISSRLITTLRRDFLGVQECREKIKYCNDRPRCIAGLIDYPQSDVPNEIFHQEPCEAAIAASL